MLYCVIDRVLLMDKNDKNKLLDAFRKLDVFSVKTIAQRINLSESDDSRKFIELLRQSGAMVVKFSMGSAEKKRNKLRTLCEELLTAGGNIDSISDLKAHFQDALLAELGFRTIIDTLSSSNIGQRDSNIQVWSVLQRAATEAKILKDLHSQKSEQLAAKHTGSVSIDDFRITDENDTPVDSDAVLTALATGTRLAIFSMAHKERWFDDNGVIVLPVKPKLTQEMLYEAGMHTLLAAKWSSLESAWDRSRLFRARFSLSSLQNENNPKSFLQILTVTAPDEFEKMQSIAGERLNQIYYQDVIKFRQMSGLAKLTVTCEDKPPFALPPVQYLSVEELVSSIMFEKTFYLPFLDSNQTFFGLPLSAWVRGYALLICLAGKTDPGKLCLVSETELQQKLQLYGLTAPQAYSFISNTCLVSGSDDMFDTPLVRVADGSLIVFTPVLGALTLWRVVLSRITSLNRARLLTPVEKNENIFSDKGAAFEEEMRKRCKDAGLIAEGFSYKIGSIKYDCDLCVLLDDVLFVFECKNYALAFDHIPCLYYYKKNLHDFATQVCRIAKDLDNHPEIIREKLGENTTWKRVVPVVLQAMPWSFGKFNNAYFYDASAFLRLVGDGVVRIVSSARINGSAILRRHCYPLRKGEIPSASELLRELKNPVQLKMSGTNWTIRSTTASLSASLVLNMPNWFHGPVTMEEQMIALGSSPDAAKLRSQELSVEFPEEVDKLRSKLDERQRLGKNCRKVGRNSLCPCGSGKKHKKCCGSLQLY